MAATTAGIALVGCFVAASFLLRQGVPVNHDVAWLVVAAGRMLTGGGYAQDFFEVNMPLAIAAYIPVHWIARALDVGLPESVHIYVYPLILLSLLLSWLVAGRLEVVRAGGYRHFVWMAWLGMVLAIFPAYEFAQKEHLSAVLTLPFVLSMGAAPGALGHGLRSGVTVLAAAGCYMKPHYAMLPVLLLLARAPVWGWRRSIASLELVVLLGTGMLYALLVVWLYPDWFTVARWTLDLYGQLQGRDPMRFIRAESATIALGVTTLLLGAALFLSRTEQLRLLPFMAATAYAWLAFYLQGKGWRYQLLPAAIFSAASLPMIVWLLRTSSFCARPRFGVALVTAVSIGFAAHAVQMNRDAPKLSSLPLSAIGQAMSIMRAGDSVYVISTSVTPFFPAVLHLELEWASRYSALWPLAALGHYEHRNDARATRLASIYKAPFLASVASDFRRFSPDVAIVDLRTGQFGVPPGFDLLGYFRQSPEFAREWSAYFKVGESRDYAIYVRRMQEPRAN